MIEVGKHLSLGTEPLDENLVGVAGLQYLDCDFVLELFVDASAEVDVTHAARAEQFDELVVADALLEERNAGCRVGRHIAGQVTHGARDCVTYEIVGEASRSKQAEHLVTQRLVVRTFAHEERRPFGLGQFPGCREQAANCGPALRRHLPGHHSSSRFNHALASLRSSYSVVTDMFIAMAVSS